MNTDLTNKDVYTLAIDPVNPNTLYAGTYGGGVFKSTNGGGNWAPINTDLTSAYINSLAADPVNPNILYAGTWSGVFKTSNGGDNWSAVNTGLGSESVMALAIDPVNPNILYTGTSLNGVYASTNGGGNWSPINTGLTNTHILSLVIDPVNPDTLYAGTDWGGVFKIQVQFFSVTSSVDPLGSGSIAKNPDKSTYVSGEQVILTATPNSGYTFGSWSGDVSGTTNPATLTMDGNKTVTANFIQIPSGPDLTGIWEGLNPTCKSTKKGTKCSIKGTIEILNNGDKDAPSSTVKFYLSDDATYDEGDRFLKKVSTGKIKTEKSKIKSLSYSFKSGEVISGKYIIVVIDADNKVVEVNEGNNIIVFGPIP